MICVVVRGVAAARVVAIGLATIEATITIVPTPVIDSFLEVST